MVELCSESVKDIELYLVNIINLEIFFRRMATKLLLLSTLKILNLGKSHVLKNDDNVSRVIDFINWI